MSQVRFLADNDLKDSIVVGTIRLEPLIRFARAREFELDRSSDDDVLGFAAQHGFLVVSHDVNTMRDAAYRRIGQHIPMAGLLLVHQESAIRSVMEDLMLIWSASELEEFENRVEFLPM